MLSSEHESIAEEYVNFVTSQSVPKALNENDILKETLQDVSSCNVSLRILFSFRAFGTML